MQLQLMIKKTCQNPLKNKHALLGQLAADGLMKGKDKHSVREIKVLGKKNSLKQGVLKDFRAFICPRAYNS